MRPHVFDDFVVSKKFESASPKAGKAFLITSYVSATGWLFLHALYCIPQFAYKYLFDAGYPQLALALSDKILDMAIPSLIPGDLSMLTAYGILFIIIVRKKTIYS